MIKNKLQDILLVIGISIQIIGFIAFFKDIISNPIYSLTILLVGYLLVFYYFLNKLKKKTTKTLSIMDSMSNRIEKKSYTYSKKQRLNSLIILIILTIITISLSFIVVRANINPKAESPMKQIEKYKNRTANFDFIKINSVNWIGGGAYAIVGEKNYPFATIENTAHMERMSTFLGTACALQFEIETRSDVDIVTVDEVKVYVSDYQTLPIYKSMLPLPFEDANILYIEIDNPANSRTKSFTATKRVDKGKLQDIGVMYLKKGKPETFVVRINAKTPGIYKLSTQIVVRNKKDVQTITLNEPAYWLFDN